MGNLTRRGFAAAVTAFSYSQIRGANERVRMGYIGLGNRGDQVHDAFLEHGDNETVAVCDLRQDYMDLAVKKSRRTPKKYTDYRRLLEDKEVDAVMIATPDHWHALMFVEACNAGKDVYVEKPLSLTVAEGRKMVETADRTKRVVQVGIHRRSAKFLQEAVDFVRSGALGKITVARGFHLQNEWPLGIGKPPDSPPPDPEMWDKWLGPAPKMAYNPNRMFYRFRWFYPFSGGQVTNFGVHYVDMLRWCLGQDAPKSVTTIGGKYAIDDNREIPDTLEALWEWDGPTLMAFLQYNANAAPANAQGSEMELRGTKGTMYLFGNRWEVIPEQPRDVNVAARTPVDRTAERAGTRKPAMEARSAKGSADTAHHARNFLDCIKSRKKCNCDIVDGHLSTSATLIANIALKMRAHLDWDARAEKFRNNDAANKLLQYNYRPPYKL
jgi:predicted dehydrogenase